MPHRKHRYTNEWAKRLAAIRSAAIEDRAAYKSLVETARTNAAAWHTCAVGAALGLGPREKVPSEKWAALGDRFYVAVLARDWSTAEDVLATINAAAADVWQAADDAAAPAPKVY